MFELINISPNPFTGINRRTANLIITSTRRGKVTIGGMVIYDYTPYYTIYSEMCGYYFRNFNYFLNRAPEIRNMSVGNAVIHLLKTGKF